MDREEEKKLEEEEEELERQEREEQAEKREREREKRLRDMEGPRNVVNLHPSQAGAGKNNVVQAKMRVIGIEPKSFDDAQQVANKLRAKKPVRARWRDQESRAQCIPLRAFQCQCDLYGGRAQGLGGNAVARRYR